VSINIKFVANQKKISQEINYSGWLVWLRRLCGGNEVKIMLAQLKLSLAKKNNEKLCFRKYIVSNQKESLW
jgi:hypothetical protein